MEVVIVSIVAFIGLFVGMAVVNKKKQARRKLLVLEALTPQGSSVEVDPQTGAAACKVRGFSVRFRFATRGAGSSAESWTECDVNVPVAPLTLSLRPQRPGHGKLIAEGLAVDVEIGDPIFDARYLVEGAPAAVVKQALTPEVRSKIQALDVDELDVQPPGILVARRGWREEHAAVQAFVDLAVSMAESVGPAIARVAEVEAPQPTSAYRGSAVSADEQQKWQSARRDAAARQAAEVDKLETVRARRAEWSKRRVKTLALVMLLLFLVGCAFILTKA